MRSDAGGQTPALLPLAFEISEAFETSSHCTEAKTEAQSRGPTTPESSNQNSSAGFSALLPSTSNRLGHGEILSFLLPTAPLLSCQPFLQLQGALGAGGFCFLREGIPDLQGNSLFFHSWGRGQEKGGASPTECQPQSLWPHSRL